MLPYIVPPCSRPEIAFTQSFLNLVAQEHSRPIKLVQARISIRSTREAEWDIYVRVRHRRPHKYPGEIYQYSIVFVIICLVNFGYGYIYIFIY